MFSNLGSNFAEDDDYTKDIAEDNMYDRILLSNYYKEQKHKANFKDFNLDENDAKYFTSIKDQNVNYNQSILNDDINNKYESRFLNDYNEEKKVKDGNKLQLNADKKYENPWYSSGI